jgi:hypothetical protein
MTDQLNLAVVAFLGLLVLLIIVFEAEETWRWRGSENRPQSRFRIVRFIRRAVGGLFAIVTFGRSSGGHTSSSEPAPMASEDVTRRLGYGDGPVHIAPQRIVVSGSQPLDVARLSPAVLVVPPLAVERTSRLRLIRDTVGATLVLAGFVVVAVNVVIPPSNSPTPSAQVLELFASAPATPTPAPTLAPPASQVALATEEPSPTETVLVSSTPTPTPTPHATKTRTPQPTAPPPLPTTPPTSTPKPTKPPTPKPTKTPTPAAVITSFTASTLTPAVNETVAFSFTFKNATSYTLDYSDGSNDSGSLSGTALSRDHAFLDPGPYTVVLTVVGPGGQANDSVPINVQ